MAEHTPGPWHVGSGEGEGSIFADEGRMKLEEGKTTLYPIAIINPGWEAEQANARLIASAPALLEALKAMREAFGYEGERISSVGEEEGRNLRALEATDAAIAQGREAPAHA